MTFSVIIPCYNCAKSLADTVSSIQGCGLTDYEILLVDDGSTDGTAELCDSLCARAPALRCIHQPNAGVSAARNRGLAEALGDYVWFVDADDTVEPFDPEDIRQAMHGGADCILFGMQFLYLRHGKQIMQEALSCGSILTLTRQELGTHFKTLFEKNYLSAIWNKLIRKSILTDNHLAFDNNLINYEDLHFSLLLLACCEKIVTLPGTYYRYINVFGHDRTVDRIARIPDVIACTDTIVAPFYALNDRLCQGGYPPLEGLSEIVLRLYLEAAYFKLMTANGAQLRQLCTAVQQSETIQAEAASIGKLSPADQRLYRWMMQNAYTKIRLFMQYRALRRIASRIYRIARSYLGK